MILFKTLKYKNFLSTGNNWTEIPLMGSRSTLIIGKNGSGKSTLIDAISFGLFGKAYRNINKPQLVNSVNNKDCVVEIEFNVHGSEFKVIRGIKPTRFEIYKDGVFLNQESTSKDFQKLLENNILKLNHKSFHQIVVVGSSSFTPFMQLKPADRRIVIEDLLDITVFTEMNNIIKDRLSFAKGNVKNIENSIEFAKKDINSQETFVENLSRYHQAAIDEKNEIITTNENLIKEHEQIIDELKEKFKKYDLDFDSIIKNGNSKVSLNIEERTKIMTKMNMLMEESEFFEKNEVCPTCTQNISEDFRKEKRLNIINDAETLGGEYDKYDSLINELRKELDQAQKFNAYRNNLLNQISNNEYKITLAKATIDRTREEIEMGDQSSQDIIEARSKLKTLQEAYNNLLNDKVVAEEDLTYAQALAEMLTDKGIKSKIIHQYLPIINNLVNNYLQILDFYVHFELTDSFGEVIKSRHRDNFSYSSFSEGEKQRIDLALLFTWREIANSKNSVSTNLLVLDETFDSSLDNEGIENLIKIVNSFDDATNIFIVSHKGEILEGRFNRKFEFYKDKNFSKVRYD